MRTRSAPMSAHLFTCSTVPATFLVSVVVIVCINNETLWAISLCEQHIWCTWQRSAYALPPRMKVYEIDYCTTGVENERILLWIWASRSEKIWARVSLRAESDLFQLESGQGFQEQPPCLCFAAERLNKPGVNAEAYRPCAHYKLCEAKGDLASNSLMGVHSPAVLLGARCLLKPCQCWLS